MTCFRPDGHLTDAALTALVRGDCLEELDRLELAEHLAYCDQCLQRYAELLSEGPMLTPARSCRGEPAAPDPAAGRPAWRQPVRHGRGGSDPGPDAAVGQRKPVRTGAFHCALASGAGGHCPDRVDRRLATGVGGGPLRLLRPI